MAVAAEGSPHAISYVYVVGGEDYVFRECKRKLLKLGVNVAGHASYRWKNPQFEVPKLTTAILVVTDECRMDMRARAHEQGERWGIPVVEAPAREHWGHAEEALRKFGVIEAMAGIVPLSPSTAPATPTTTLGEAIAAKGESLAPAPIHDSMPSSAEPTPNHEKEPITMPSPAMKVKTDSTKPTRDLQRELAVKLLRESKGKAGDIPIADIVSRQTGTVCSIYVVRKARRQEKIPPAKPGALSVEQVAFFKKYGVKTKQGVQLQNRAKGDATAPTPIARARRARHLEAARAVGADEPGDVAEAIRQAVRHLDETVVQRFHLTSLSLSVDAGVWQQPEFEQVTVNRGTVKLR